MKCRYGWIIAACILALTFSGCEDMGDLTTESKTVEADGAESVEVNLKMGAGELRVSGGARALMEADFTYRSRRKPPEVDYYVSGGRGVLTVRHRRSGGPLFGSSKYLWDVRLNGGIPVKLEVDLGAGESRLDLSDLDLRSLTIDMGVGEMKLDLRGRYGQNLDVSIDGGIGSGTIYFPDDAGVRVRVDGGIGSVNAAGFTKSGHVYTNDAYAKSPITIDVNVDAGIGSIDLRLD
ncbi:MAG: toast rack family protein [Candidatus Aminicenantales bacterium]